jgi:Fic family protein
MLNVDTLRISPELLGLIARIDEFKGAWRALGTLAPERLAALRRVATIESIGSSTRIEGSRLSDREVERLLSNLETKVEREKLVLAALPELALRIVELAREHGRVRMGEVVKLTGASRNTLKVHLRTLVERGFLNQHGAGRGVWYDLG